MLPIKKKKKIDLYNIRKFKKKKAPIIKLNMSLYRLQDKQIRKNIHKKRNLDYLGNKNNIKT